MAQWTFKTQNVVFLFRQGRNECSALLEISKGVSHGVALGAKVFAALQG